MAIYEYYCPTCREKFEQRRSMSEAALAARCAKGHRAERTLSAFAMSRGGLEEFAQAPASGGCCGGGACACAANAN